MDRRTFMKSTMAAGVAAVIPGGVLLREPFPAWVADGDGWRQVRSLLDIKKGDIFVISWPMQFKAVDDGMIDPSDGREGVPAINYPLGGPSVYPPYPWCARCGDPRVVPPEERTDVDERHRKVCDLCIADPGRAERKKEAFRRYLELNPPANIG